MLSTSIVLGQGYDFFSKPIPLVPLEGVFIETPRNGEDIFSFIQRLRGKMDLNFYRQLIGAANEFKEGDQTLGLAAKNEASRTNARKLLSQTKVGDLDKNILHQDGILDLIHRSTFKKERTKNWTVG